MSTPGHIDSVAYLVIALLLAFGDREIRMLPPVFKQGVRPMNRTNTQITIEQKWHEISEATKKEAQKLPHGKEREALVRKACELETASHMNAFQEIRGGNREYDRQARCQNVFVGGDVYEGHVT
jgi:hypothetical protein